MKRFPAVPALLAACVLAGCAASGAPELSSREVGLPSVYAAPAARADAAAAPSPAEAQWWRAFGSEELDRIVERARRDGFDAASAQARLLQRTAIARAAAGALWPQVSAGVSVERDARAGGSSRATADTGIAALLTTTYEIDLWGGRTAAYRSADAAARASAFERDTVLLAATAAAAEGWIDVVALRERVALARLNLADADRLAMLVEARRRAGAASPLDVAQQRNLVAGQERALALLVQSEAQARSALSLRLGDAAAVVVDTDSLAALRVPAAAAVLPSALLTRRPDVARAEAELAAAEADVQVARAAMLPSLGLSLGAGASSAHLRALMHAPVYALAAGLVAPVFSAGRLEAQHERTRARREELLVEYRRTVVNAFGDVESSLLAIAGLDAQRAAHAEALLQARRAAALARARWRAGGETLLALLEAQRTVHAAEDLAIQLQAQRLQASISLYKALGGGWSVPAA